jgi:hypothetical protein
MEKFLRWVSIKLLVRSCLNKADDYSEVRKVFNIVNRGAICVRLIGQKPGMSFIAPGRKCFVLMGECIHYTVNRTTLRTPGAYFPASGILTVKPGPGVSWCWYLQIGR